MNKQEAFSLFISMREKKLISTTISNRIMKNLFQHEQDETANEQTFFTELLTESPKQWVAILENAALIEVIFQDALVTQFKLTELGENVAFEDVKSMLFR